MLKTRLAFFASYNGSSAHAITHACANGHLPAQAVLLMSNNENCAAFDWAKTHGLDTLCIKNKTDAEISNIIKDHKIDLGICSGYMKLIGPEIISAVPSILNIHPALLPKYGGKGMYGHNVHKAVKESGDKETGATIHLVNNKYDEGAIVAQKKIPISPKESADDIEAKVKAIEPDFYVETLQKILSGEITL